MKYLHLLLSALFVTITAPAMAAHHEKAMPDEAEMKKMMEMMKPGEHHKALEPLVGDWNYTMTFRMSADAPEQTASGTGKNEWVLDGHFLKQTVAGEMMMGEEKVNYKGLGYLGYDNMKKHYTSTWLDNMTTSMMHGTGSYDEANKVFTETGTFACPMKGGEVAYRSTTKVVDENNLTFTMFTTENGKEYESMVIKYTRK